MYHRNRLTLNEFENKLWPFPLGIADYPAGPAMDASRYRIVQLYDLSVEGSADDTWPLVVRRFRIVLDRSQIDYGARDIRSCIVKLQTCSN